MDLDDLLQHPSADDRIAGIADAALRAAGALDTCPTYRAALRGAAERQSPPFVTDDYVQLYRDASADPHWMAMSLIANAEREGDGSKRLWSLASCSLNLEEQHLLKAHAVDESRHALIYLALLDLAFPGLTDQAFRLELTKLSPHYSMRMTLRAVEGSPYAKAPSIDDFIQMNIAEIRTAIHHLMQRLALAKHASPENRSRMQPMLDALLKDELRHVAYTAKLIEPRAASAPALVSMIERRLRDFNQITREELGSRAFDCSVACCEKRPGCRAKVSATGPFVDAPF